MAIKDQCIKCKYITSDENCSFMNNKPDYNQTSCIDYKMMGINIEKNNSNNTYIPLQEGEDLSDESNKKMFKNPFSFEGRIRRLEFGLSYIIYTFGYTLLAIFENDHSLLYLQIILIIPLVWFILAQGTKRCHDRGVRGWYQFIPFYVFWMLFADGDLNENKFGKNPKL